MLKAKTVTRRKNTKKKQIKKIIEKEIEQQQIL